MAFVGGLSFNLSDVIIPKEKEELINRGYEDVQEVMNNYSMGFIPTTNATTRLSTSGHTSTPNSRASS